MLTATTHPCLVSKMTMASTPKCHYASSPFAISAATCVGFSRICWRLRRPHFQASFSPFSCPFFPSCSIVSLKYFSSRKIYNKISRKKCKTSPSLLAPLIARGGACPVESILFYSLEGGGRWVNHRSVAILLVLSSQDRQSFCHVGERDL